MRLGGIGTIRDCSFLSNPASTRGLAIAVVGTASISGAPFDGNDVYCAGDSCRSNAEEVRGNGQLSIQFHREEYPTAAALLESTHRRRFAADFNASGGTAWHIPVDCLFRLSQSAAGMHESGIMKESSFSREHVKPVTQISARRQLAIHRSLN